MMAKKKYKLADFDETLKDLLKDPEEAVAYLNEALKYEGPNKEKYFLKSLRQVVEAHGITTISKNSTISRRALYKALSEKGNPTWHTIVAIMTAINCNFKIFC